MQQARTVDIEEAASVVGGVGEALRLSMSSETKLSQTKKTMKVGAAEGRCVFPTTVTGKMTT